MSTGNPDTLAAFKDAVEWFHNQIDREIDDHKSGDHADRPDTAREYFSEYRDWSDETISTKLLGWAPPNASNELINYLYDECGHKLPEIRATGFFGKNLTLLFSGRYVLPYFDRNGDPVYAIGRCTGSKGGGDAGYDGHPTDFIAGKYAKLAHSKDWVDVDEPIYGLGSVSEDTDKLLVAGGIADAISLHEAGYSCISPVTTVRFKGDHEPRVVELVEEYDISGVYMLNDAERPSVDKTESDGPVGMITDVLTIQQFGEGQRAAFGNAEFLTGEGIDVYLTDLPGGNDTLRKTDPDDLLKDDWATVETVLANARPAHSHPGYATWTENRKPRQLQQAANLTPTGDPEESDGEASALFDLEYTDVVSLSEGERSDNPLGHHGDSHGYFTVIDYGGDAVGFDHKYGVAYNALTHILCASDERRADDPNGQLTDAEIFEAWKYAKQNGLIDSTDPIPRRALRHIAIENGLCSRDEIDGGWKLPRDAYNDGLANVRHEHGVDPGRTLLDGDGDPIALLPNAPRNRVLTESDGPEITVDGVREQTTEAITSAMENGLRWLVDVPPTGGKTYGAVAAAADPNTPPVSVLTTRGRKEQYDQLAQWGEERGLEVKQLPSFHDDCPVAAGEYGEELQEEVLDYYRRGATGKEIHKLYELVTGERLPCQHDHKRDEQIQCPYTLKWNFDASEYDLLVGHYVHGYNEKVTAGRAVVFDEFPGDSFEYRIANIQGAITHFLKSEDEIPYDEYTELVEHRHDDERRADAIVTMANKGVDTDAQLVLESGSAHAAAPLATFTLLCGAEDGNNLENGMEIAPFPEDDARIGVYDREQAVPFVLDPPDLEDAEAVVGLDGTPTVEMWRLALGEDLTHRQILTADERAEYIRDALGIKVIQTTEYTKPYNSEGNINVNDDAALLEAINDKHDDEIGVISTKTAFEQYRENGVLKYDPKTGDVHDGPADKIRWYGNVLGSNKMAQTRVGAVFGSNHYGDNFIKKWGAYAGRTIERNDERGDGLSYGAFGDKILTHMREHETVQAVLRFGRDGDGATVYLHTSAAPDSLPIEDCGQVIRPQSAGERQVIDAVKDRQYWTTADIVDLVDVGERRVRQILNNLYQRGYLDRGQCVEDARRVRWENNGLEEIAEHVDLPELDTEVESGKDRMEYIYTWISATGGVATPTTTGQSTFNDVATDGGGPVTDDSDGPPSGGDQ